jgi:hypothetical protein
MTDWEIQIFISDLKKIVQFGSVVFDVIWNKMSSDVKVFLIAWKMQECHYIWNIFEEKRK